MSVSASWRGFIPPNICIICIFGGMKLHIHISTYINVCGGVCVCVMYIVVGVRLMGSDMVEGGRAGGGATTTNTRDAYGGEYRLELVTARLETGALSPPPPPIEGEV